MEGIRQNDSPLAIPALRITRFGRFGNNVVQIIQAIHIAKKIRGRRIDLRAVNVGGLAAPFCHGRLELNPHRVALLPEPTLVGAFFYRNCFEVLYRDFDSGRRPNYLRD